MILANRERGTLSSLSYMPNGAASLQNEADDENLKVESTLIATDTLRPDAHAKKHLYYEWRKRSYVTRAPQRVRHNGTGSLKKNGWIKSRCRRQWRAFGNCRLPTYLPACLQVCQIADLVVWYTRYPPTYVRRIAHTKNRSHYSISHAQSLQRTLQVQNRFTTISFFLFNKKREFVDIAYIVVSEISHLLDSLFLSCLRMDRTTWAIYIHTHTHT